MKQIHGVVFFSILASACIGSIGGGTVGNGAGGGQPAPGNKALSAACSPNYSPGHVPIHRLTNAEYNNTVRDLLFTSSTPGNAFDPSPPGQSGFENDSAAQIITDELISEYYTAAKALSQEVIGSKGTAGGAYSKIVTCAPSTACAQTTITNLATLAYRRPITSAETTSLMAVYNNDSDFDTGLGDVIITLLMDPKFLFVYFTNAQSQVAGATYAIDDYGLAARLSYALWQTMPDATLLQLAQSGQLHEEATLQAQVVRMLGDPKVSSMLLMLRNDWAGLLTLADPTGTLVGLDDSVRLAMVGEVDAFLQDLVSRDGSFLNTLTADYTFVNQTMATYYNIPFTGSDPAAYTRVPLPANRVGLMTSPAVLTATAGDVTFTHPVHRGLYITQRITCDPPSPPPAGIKAVNFDPQSGGGTAKQKLIEHADNPACSGCHAVMDAYGLGLENYDSFGNWRDAYPAGVGPVDPSGTMPAPDNRPFSTPFQMIGDIASDPATQSCLAQQLFAYVITRALTSSDDQCVSQAIGAQNVTTNGTFSGLTNMIIQSHQFLMQTGEAP